MPTLTPEEIRALALKSWTKHAAKLELNSDLIGQSFKYEEADWKVVGLSRRVRKLPLLAERNDGKFKTFKLEMLNEIGK